MNKILSTILLVSLSTLIIFSGCSNSVKEIVAKADTPYMAEEYLTTENLMHEKEFNETVELIALVTMAEAEGECEEGKRLVIDTILNRVDSVYFPDNVYDVIYQPYQFSSLWDGRIERCEVREDICRLVEEELESRLNYDCVFFNAEQYSDYGVPLFQVENHYFSSYD